MPAAPVPDADLFVRSCADRYRLVPDNGDGTGLRGLLADLAGGAA